MEEIRRIGALGPKVSEKQKRRVRELKLLDDGIYDENGRFIGEKHPDD